MTGTIFAVLGLAAGLFLLDRLLLGFERRGWIHWRRSRGSSGALGTAMLEAQKLLEPSKRHVVEERRRESVEDAGSGGEPPRL